MHIEKKTGLLEKTRIYELEAVKKIPAGQKPKYHFAVPTGWSNDPNGFSYYGGKYHLFYQYSPYSTTIGQVHWGHCVTKDFITWEYLPAALAPDKPYDKDGIFSGSGIERDGKHVLMYTGVVFRFLTPEDEEAATGPDGAKKIFELMGAGRIRMDQVQNIAIGDGLNYEKIPENPVISTEMLPDNSNRTNFRDPRIWRSERDNRFYAVIAGMDTDGDGQILLYSSEELKSWHYEGILYKNNHEYGDMWECPDFFPLDGKYVLIASPEYIKDNESDFPKGPGNVGLIGEYDSIGHKFIRQHIQMLDYGMDFYATQTLQALDGRRILIGWMGKFSNRPFPSDYEWAGMMTLPREMRIENGELYMEPVRELKNYYMNCVTHKNIVLDGLAELEGVRGRYLDMIIEVKAGEYEEFSVEVAVDERRKTIIRYTNGKSLLAIDRTYTGHEQDNAKMFSTRVSDQGGMIQIRIILDNCALEVYANRGEKVMSALVFTPEDAIGIRFASKGKVMFDLEKNDLCIK